MAGRSLVMDPLDAGVVKELGPSIIGRVEASSSPSLLRICLNGQGEYYTFP
jgi:hypothetical protein